MRLSLLDLRQQETSTLASACSAKYTTYSASFFGDQAPIRNARYKIGLFIPRPPTQPFSRQFVQLWHAGAGMTVGVGSGSVCRIRTYLKEDTGNEEGPPRPEPNLGMELVDDWVQGRGMFSQQAQPRSVLLSATRRPRITVTFG